MSADIDTDGLGKGIAEWSMGLGKGIIGAVDGSWKGVMVWDRDATLGCRMAVCRAMGCRVAGHFGVGCGCVMIALLRAVMNGHESLAVCHLQNMGL